MTTQFGDYYATLGISRDATQAEISHAYRALLRLHHPDTRAPADDCELIGSDAALQDVLAAYAVLRDPVRRAAYDRAWRGRPRPAKQRDMNVSSQPPIIAGPVRWHTVWRA
jgi:curved DNA-binding protein CbpA